MNPPEAQAILREHGVPEEELFPRPWLSDWAGRVMRLRVGKWDEGRARSEEYGGYIDWQRGRFENRDFWIVAKDAARETAILMGWSPANAEARPADWKAESDSDRSDSDRSDSELKGEDDG